MPCTPETRVFPVTHKLSFFATDAEIIELVAPVSQIAVQLCTFFSGCSGFAAASGVAISALSRVVHKLN